MRTLVTGASGLLGVSVCLAFKNARDEVVGTYLSHPGPFPFSARLTDLRDRESVSQLFAEFQPDCLVHCAALSRVIECERDAKAAYEHNVIATRLLAELAAASDTHFIFVSTDQVFDGVSGNHKESDLVAPTHVYGRTKAEAERLVQEYCPRSLILRSNNIVGRNLGFGRSFTDGVIERLKRGEKVALFHDQTRSPIHLTVITKLIVRLARDRVFGCLHAGGPEQISRYETGIRLVHAHGLSERNLVSASVATHPDERFLHREGTFDTSKLCSLYPDLGYETIDEGFRSDAARS